MLSTVEAFIILNSSNDFSTSLPNCIDYEEFIRSGEDNNNWIEVAETDACGMCYTSGTTGPPKGVLYSHRLPIYMH